MNLWILPIGGAASERVYAQPAKQVYFMAGRETLKYKGWSKKNEGA